MLGFALFFLKDMEKAILLFLKLLETGLQHLDLVKVVFEGKFFQVL